MGKIKKIKDRELVGGSTEEEIYPITSTKAVYNSNNEDLDSELEGLKTKLGKLESSIIEDAPSDSTLYGRFNNTWKAIEGGGGSGDFDIWIVNGTLNKGTVTKETLTSLFSSAEYFVYHINRSPFILFSDSAKNTRLLFTVNIIGKDKYILVSYTSENSIPHYNCLPINIVNSQFTNTTFYSEDLSGVSLPTYTIESLSARFLSEVDLELIFSNANNFSSNINTFPIVLITTNDLDFKPFIVSKISPIKYELIFSHPEENIIITINLSGSSDNYMFLSGRISKVSLIEEAPKDGLKYVRKNGTWVQEESGSSTGGIGEAPSDGKVYGRSNETWVSIESTSGISEAPSDGNKYVRQNKSWVRETQINTSNFATKSELSQKVNTSDIADMLTKTEASSTYATKESLSRKLDTTTYNRDKETFATDNDLNLKQNKLVSGSNIKTVNGQSLLGSGNIEITGGSGSGISDAPSDGKTYGREDGTWVEIPTISNEILDIWEIPVESLADNSNIPRTTLESMFSSLGYFKNYIANKSPFIALLTDPGRLVFTVYVNDASLYILSAVNRNAIVLFYIYVSGNEFNYGRIRNIHITEEAPSDGKIYGRKNKQWTAIETSGGSGIADAPADDKTYGRKNNQWVSIGDSTALYGECVMPADNADKSVIFSNFTLITGVRVIVKMKYSNTADDVVLTLSSDSGGVAKPLFYNGKRANSKNCWRAGSILDIVYDGENYQATEFTSQVIFDLGEVLFNFDTKNVTDFDNIKVPGLYKFTVPVYYGSGLLQVDIVDTGRKEGIYNVNVYRQTVYVTGSLKLGTDIDYFNFDKFEYATRVTSLDGTIWKNWMKCDLPLTRFEP